MKFQTSTWLQFLMAIGLYSKDTACDAFSSSSRMHKLLDVQVAHPFTITKIRHDHQSTASRSRLHSTSSSSYPTPTIKTSGTPYENTQEQEQELIANIQSYKNSNSISEKPTHAAFTSLIEQWLTFPQPERAQFVLDRMEELYTPSGRIYERIINAWSFAAAECIDRVNLLDDAEGDISNDNGNSNDNDNDNVNDQRSEEDEEELLKKKKKLREESVYCSAKAFDLLSRMELLHQEISGGDFRPALSTYTSVINSIMRSCKTDPGAAAGASTNSDGMEDNERSAKEGVDLASQRETVERIRSRRDEIYQQRNDIDHHLKIRIHNIQDVFDILDLFQEDGVVVAAAAFERNSSGRVAKASAGQQKQQVSMELEETPHELFAKMKRGPQGSLVASRFNFNLIINALAQTGETWAAQAAENILDYMVNQCSAIGGEVDVKISDDQTNGIKSKSNSKRNRSTTRSKDKVKLNVLQTHPQLTPSIETINGCINAWAHCTSTEPTAPTRAEAILEKLNDLQQQGKLTTVTPDNVSYNTIIKAYANKADAERAEAILGTMVELYESTGDDKIKPDIISYSSVLNAYAKAAQRDPYASKKSEDILMQMVQMQERENTRTRGNVKGRTRIVNTWCFNTVLNAYAVQGAGSRASALLHQMEVMGETDDLVKPDTYSFNTVLKALANSNEKGSIERARLILDKMEKCFANGDTRVKPDAITYNTVVSAYANNGGMTVGRAGKSIVTNNGGKRVGRAAKSIVKRMEDRYLDGDLEVKPTSPTYTSLIKAFNWERESTRHAEEVVASLRNNPISGNGLIRPDTAIFNALLNCWAKNGSRSAARRAEEILAEMKMEYNENGDIRAKPNTRTYTTVIDVLAKSGEKGSAYRALEILDEMEMMGDKHAKPNVYTYTTVINCIARSKEVDKAVKAVDVLQRMEEQHRQGNEAARPNVIAYNTVLNACAYTPNDAKAIETAFKIACLVFDEVRTSCHVQPSHVTYGTFLSVCANLMPEAEIRDNLVEATFKRCARDGMASKMVWRNLNAAASPRLLNEFLDQANSGLESTWSRNV